MQGYNGFNQGIIDCISYVCVMGSELSAVVTAEADIISGVFEDN